MGLLQSSPEIEHEGEPELLGWEIGTDAAGCEVVTVKDEVISVYSRFNLDLECFHTDTKAKEGSVPVTYYYIRVTPWIRIINFYLPVVCLWSFFPSVVSPFG